MADSTRLMLGVAAAALMVAGVVLVVATENPTNGEILIRVGVVLGAVWLVAPLIRRPSVATLAVLGVGSLVVLRPRLIVPVAVGAIIWRLSQRE